MAETVEFRLEQSLPELQDLVKKELFSQDEIRAIIKKRTEHEHTLLRRTAKKSDHLRYIQYEMNLEALRQKRLKRKQKHGRKSVSDYAGPKHIRSIFQKATRRFADIGLWMQYIDYSKSQGSSKLTGNLFGEALQKFPSSAELWILAAQHEYNTNFNIVGARNLFLRSLRLNPEKRELWLEYAKLECLYVLKILERRRILGLDKAQEQLSEDSNAFEGQDEIILPTITEEDLRRSDGPRLDPLLTSPLTDISNNPALNGAIPLAVYSSAITTRPEDISLIAGFYDMFASLQSRVPFINSALDRVKKHLEETFPGRGMALLVQIKDHGRGLDPVGKEFPSAIREMIKTSNSISSLPFPERKECSTRLLRYLEGISLIQGLDENLQKVIKLFERRVRKWQDMDT